MFDQNNAAYLIRALSTNNLILFLGAGFSSEASNRLGEKLPIGRTLASAMWNLLQYEGEYDGTPLPDMYEAVLASGLPHARINDFLESHLLATHIPQDYESLVKVYWYRIYTTNVDQVVPEVYSRYTQPKLDILAYLNDEPRERDQSLRQIQLIHLNGRLPCKPDEITFSIRQYARRATETSPLYEQFVLDYATHPTIFTGTELNEPLFWQHVEARAKRRAAIPELRPKSFLVAPKISPPKQAQLKAFNIVPVEGTVFDFLAWLNSIASQLPDRREIVRVTVPSLATLFETIEVDDREKAVLIEFADSFHMVPSNLELTGDRSLYLLGATPRWEDISRNLDAPREITDVIYDCIEKRISEDGGLSVMAILGSAGCGKSTILRRLGVRLVQAGRRVFLTNSEAIPAPHVIARALNFIGVRSVLLFDNSEIALAAIPALIEEFKSLEKPPILALASRTNEYDRRADRLEKVTQVTEFQVPHLSRREIVDLIRILDENNLLGNLQGMSDKERIREFEIRAKKQVLVAMREATSGRGFDEIIENEFASLTPTETQILYLCAALATYEGYRITEQEFIGCADVEPAEALYLLKRNLRDIVLPTGSRGDLLLLRHRTIAEHIVDNVAPRPLLRAAYVRLLTVLASEIGGREYRSRVFGLYRDLINHARIYRRFIEDLDDARSIYESLAQAFRSESHFWLQYGSLELEYGNLELAENYLRQAESLSPEWGYVQNAIGHLLLRKAIAAENTLSAVALRDEGSAILKERMYVTHDAYSYHIYCAQRLAWLHRWTDNIEERVVELEHLRETSKVGCEEHPRSWALRKLRDDIEREYLRLALPPS